MNAARAHGQDVWSRSPRIAAASTERVLGAPACRAPSARAYRAAVRTFDDRFPWVRSYSAWNEVNHVSQPTFGRPHLAVRYYRVCAERAGGASG